jgi:hypothetical protein
MRPLFLLAMTCTAGCDQLVGPGTTSSESEPAASSVATHPAPPRVRWTTSHDGVSLSSAGTVSLMPDEGPALDVLHVRVGLSPGASTISADASAAALAIPGRPAIHPVAVDAGVSTLPIAIMDPGSTQNLDLFFPLRGATGPAVAFLWTITASGEPLALRASLQLDGDAPADRPSLAGRHWWFAPGYAWPRFRHQDGVITARPPTDATVKGLRDDREADRAEPSNQ